MFSLLPRSEASLEYVQDLLEHEFTTISVSYNIITKQHRVTKELYTEQELGRPFRDKCCAVQEKVASWTHVSHI